MKIESVKKFTLTDEEIMQIRDIVGIIDELIYENFENDFCFSLDDIREDLLNLINYSGNNFLG